MDWRTSKQMVFFVLGRVRYRSTLKNIILSLAAKIKGKTAVFSRYTCPNKKGASMEV